MTPKVWTMQYNLYKKLLCISLDLQKNGKERVDFVALHSRSFCPTEFLLAYFNFDSNCNDEIPFQSVLNAPRGRDWISSSQLDTTLITAPMFLKAISQTITEAKYFIKESVDERIGSKTLS